LLKKLSYFPCIAMIKYLRCQLKTFVEKERASQYLAIQLIKLLLHRKQFADIQKILYIHSG